MRKLLFLLILLLLFTTAFAIFALSPIDEVTTMLRQMEGQSGIFAKTSNMPLSADYGKVLSKSPLTEKIKLSEKQLCLSLGNFEGSADWKKDKTEISYVGTQDIFVNFGVFCDKSNTFRENIEEGSKGVLKDEYLNECTLPKTDEIFCIVALIGSEQDYSKGVGAFTDLAAIALITLLIISLILLILKIRKRLSKIIYVLNLILLLLVLSLIFFNLYKFIPLFAQSAVFVVLILLIVGLGVVGLLKRSKDETKLIKWLSWAVLIMDVIVWPVLLLSVMQVI
ncbi:MAG: hypothetical protein V1672_04590 [Candidatus Diapherotrites archaeon]